MRITLNHCLLLSLALHGTLLAVYRPQPRLGEETSTLAVTLIDGDRQPPAARNAAAAVAGPMIGHTPTAAATRVRAAHRRTLLLNTTPADAQPNAAIVPFIASTPAPSKHGTSTDLSSAATRSGAAPAAADGARAQTAIWLRSRLLSAFANYFDYPLLARRRGLEGQVKLTLRIEPDGRISHLQVAQSSGYAALDEAALASARRIEQLTDVTLRLHGISLDMILPIEYRLLGV